MIKRFEGIVCNIGDNINDEFVLEDVKDNELTFSDFLAKHFLEGDRVVVFVENKNNACAESKPKERCVFCGKWVVDYACVLNKPACKDCDGQLRAEYEKEVLQRNE